MKDEIYITKVIRSATNNNELCKQHFAIYGTSEDNVCLLVNKLVLSSDFELYKDFKLLRTFKEFGLFYSQYSIKLDTFIKVSNWIEELINK